MARDGLYRRLNEVQIEGEPRWRLIREQLRSRVPDGTDHHAPGAAGRYVDIHAPVPFGRGDDLFPVQDLPPGEYRVQALLNRYETFHRGDGHTVSLPPDQGEGQHWNTKPGNSRAVNRLP